MTALYVNGIDATSGEYLVPPVDAHDVAVALTSGLPNRFTDAELRARHRRNSDRHYAPKHGVDARDLAQAGWAVVTAVDANPAVLAALRPLLEHRKAQAAAVAEGRYRVLTGDDGYRVGESKQEFHARLGVGPGPVDPDILPYHLLLVGGPEEIPFPAQYQLDIQHSVGRLHLDSVEEYARYAESVVAAERAARPPGPGRMCIFAPSNEGDPATEASSAQLAAPLATALEGAALDAAAPRDPGGRWAVASLLGAAASKEHLLDRLAGPDRPEVLFTASHGIGYPCGHPDQRRSQGALLCQDWPGPGHGPVLLEHCLTAADVATVQADLSGLVAFVFACFGAGTPQQDDFGQGSPAAKPLAPAPFVSALPQALLGREGGALAVLGHVDRAWTFSFLWPGTGSQTEVFRSSIARLADGYPVGAALEYMSDRYAEIATELALALELISRGKRVDEQMLAGLWTAYADARNFVVLGDPAVRLRSHAENFSAAMPSTAMPVTESWGTRRAGSPLDVIEVSTYVTDDPEAVSVDPATGRLEGAQLHVSSRIQVDGNADHVVTRPGPFAPQDAEREKSVTELHARLLEVSLTARRAVRGKTEGTDD